MSLVGREVRIGKNCARGLEYGPRPQAVLKTEGTVFPNTDRPRPANNVFIISSVEYFVLNFTLRILRYVLLHFVVS